MCSPISRREQRPHVSDDGVEVQHLTHHHLPPAEGEQLADQRGAAIGRALGSPSSRERSSGFLVSASSSSTLPEDDRQQVVEVVRDAAGQQPHRLHPLRIAQRFGLSFECSPAFSHALLECLVGFRQRNLRGCQTARGVRGSRSGDATLRSPQIRSWRRPADIARP